MRQIGIRLGQVASSAAAAVAISSLGTQSALGKLPSTFSDPAAEEGAKSAGMPSNNLFTVRTTTAEKMQAMSNVSLLNERISQIQDHSAGLPKLNLDQTEGKLSPQKREMFERAMAASQSRKLAALLNQRGTCLALIGERSKAISDYGAHNQRGSIAIRVRSIRGVGGDPELIWIDELIEMAEKSASSPVYPLLKREDEKYVTEHAFDNPRFVEDVVRNVAGRLQRDKRVAWYSVRVVNLESIHNHSAFARIERKK